MPTPSRSSSSPLRLLVVFAVLVSVDWLLFGRFPTRNFHLRPDEFQGLIGSRHRILWFLPALVAAIVHGLRSQRKARRDAADAAEAHEARSAGKELGRFPLDGLSVGEKLDREKKNGQVYVLLVIFAFIAYLLGSALLGLHGAAALASIAPVLLVGAWVVKRGLGPIEVVVGSEGLALHAPGSERILPLASVESVEVTKNAQGDAMLVVVQHANGRSDDLLVGQFAGDRERERTLRERADAIVACIEKARTATYR